MMMAATPMTHRCAACGQQWWDAHVCPKAIMKDGRPLFETIEAISNALPATLATDGWPKLIKPARVGNGTFGVGVSSRLVVEASQRLHEYHVQNDKPRTDAEAREQERSRRALWDMVHGPLDASKA
jgi:hypothetical protein